MKRNLLLLSITLIAAFAFGQSTDAPAPPTDAPAPPLSGTTEAPTNPSSARYEENVRPLSGVQEFDLGYRTDRMNVLTPSFTFSEGYGTNPGLSTGSQGGHDLGFYYDHWRRFADEERVTPDDSSRCRMEASRNLAVTTTVKTHKFTHSN